MKIKRILSVFLVAVILVCSLVSCGGDTATALVEKADKALLNTPYKLDMSMSMESDNQDYSEMFESMAIDTEMYIDGEKFAITLNVYGTELDMSCVGDTLYAKASVAGQSVSKVKATVTEAQREDVLGDTVGSANELMPIDFETIKMEKNDEGQTVITCTELKSEVLADYIESVSAEYEGVELNIDNIELIAILEGGKYHSITVSMDYSFGIMGESIDVAVGVSMSFDYEAGKKITVPEDADTYEEMDYDDFLG